ncbi:S49 family peptidase [Coxiella burnetii]|uniref:Signal peptide peptidase n=2 Tax=Coxiella burnetii TaxID=777 RepID=Q83AB8_COXBU|nr:S49 family peptidase [Coxiella burnetii]NP_820961.1 signal peptide peptidase [Coxiella burnetii RSA 493]AAO91475.1 signal peptide peptidase [Coxiella burnetii RSA 493]ABS76698.1 signal peptide peptidase [Coxiella burnetii Dugway 5J108-111]ACJ19235.1 signal peptide peptidase [Coxiella burnetii CbuG_Q212]ACJ21136.1 signal peptide peptidase [Coxiella burnetii CbuK_Q154]AIT64209.1 Signal peptide peptidase SppA, 36K type [Coxiella burnetii str. Namibia]
MNDETVENTLVKAILDDRRAERRWRNVRFAGWMFILLLFAILIFAPSSSELEARRGDGAYVSLVRMNGTIMSNTTFSALRVVPELRKAFADKNSKGVVLLINSPGGSPVQASIIRDKIIELKKQYHKKVVVVGEDELASGAYLVSTGADKIYVNNDTLTGSIGVIMGGFGFVDTLKKVGVTRRLFVAGDHKDRLDPFQPVKPEDVEKINKVLAQVHQNFIDQVIQGRGNRLHGDRQEIFSGDFWTGKEAAQLGVVDGTANLWTVLEREFGVKDYKDYTTRVSFLQALFHNTATELYFHLTNETSPLREQMQVD